ncbi:MAG TPA: asparaginase [Solirubrobacterales bacterium]|nr:asparaginase [Solirubrobacterales bacterium]
MAANPPKLLVIARGGTIASVPPDGGGEQVTPGLGGEALARSVPELAAIATIESVDLPPVASFELGPVQMLEIAHLVAGADAYDGVVVTQGSDTLEETTYMLALTLGRVRPVAVTGALRNPTLPSPDGPANLLAAAAVAADPRSAELGPVAVLAEEIHLARWATKAHTSRTQAIVSPGAGPAGEVVEGRVYLWHQPLYQDLLGLPRDLAGADVALLRIAAGDDGRLLSSLADDPPAGVVVEGTGGGHLPAALLPALDRLISTGIPIVLATRVAAGRNLERTYGMAGGEVDLIRRGVLPAGWLGGGKARLRLMVALALGIDPARVFPVR